jgi:hypothetical protein
MFRELIVSIVTGKVSLQQGIPIMLMQVFPKIVIPAISPLLFNGGKRNLITANFLWYRDIQDLFAQIVISRAGILILVLSVFPAMKRIMLQQKIRIIPLRPYPKHARIAIL